jgi:dihydroorotase-like cyclic amidohydrolase
MTRFDTVVTGGTLVIPGVGEVKGDLGIRDGKVASIDSDLSREAADIRIDATGKVVLPGAVDSHYHLGIYRDIATDTESETTSSLVGGVTSLVSYFRTGQHYLNKTGSYREIFPEVLGMVNGHSKVDYSFHLAPMTAEHIGEIPWLVDEMGVTSFKYYMFYKGFNLASSSNDSKSYTMSENYDLGHLFEIMEAVAAAQAERPGKRLSVSLHCEQAELMRVFIERAKANPLVSGLAEYSAGRPPLTERLAIEEAGVLADATKVNLNLLHLSSAVAMETAVELGARYPFMDVNREVTLHHLALDHESLDAKGGLGGKVNPPIRTKSDNEALWEAVRRGHVGTVASDHACCMEEEKGGHGATEVWPAQPGFGGTALLYPVMLSEGVHKRGLSLTRIAELVSANPAKTFGTYGRKGTIAVGADADLAIVDMNLEQVVTTELCQSAQDHCPFEGETVKGWPTSTVLRGMPVFQDGKVSPDFHGEYVKRG